MRNTLVLLVATVALVTVACDPATEITAPPTGDAVDLGDVQRIGLVTEDDCDALLGWLKREGAAAVPVVRQQSSTDARGMADTVAESAGSAAAQSDSAAAAPPTSTLVAGDDYSTTNVQEAGVDEPDIVKTDGKRLIAIANGQLRFVDVSGARPEQKATLAIPGTHALLLAEDRVLAIGSEATYYPMTGRGQPMPAPDIAGDERAGVAIAPVPGYSAPKTTVAVIDITNLESPSVVSELELDGTYVAARLADGVARLVLRSMPQVLAQPSETAVADSSIADWVPGYEYREPGRADADADGRLVRCDQVHHPRGFTGPEMVTVVAIDPADPRPGNGASVAGAGETVYASHDRLYVTSMRWGTATSERAAPSTEIHAFDISDEVTTTYVGSGSVEGSLLNQFAMSEHDGVLRVATTTADGTTGESESQVVALRQDGALLRQIGALGGLGKTEQIYAVRFLGELGYVVTFRQTDPLYVVDLADPTKPTLRGELKIPGYSAYLHPIAEGRLLGVGQNATEQGRRLGAQVSLFDVSDPAAPKQLATHDLGTFASAAEYDHHAFLWWPKSRLAVLPVEGMASRPAVCPPNADCAVPYVEYRPGAIGLSVEADAFVDRGRVEHPTRMPISRSIVVAGSLLTLSDSGLLASNLDTLSTTSWLPF